MMQPNESHDNGNEGLESQAFGAQTRQVTGEWGQSLNTSQIGEAEAAYAWSSYASASEGVKREAGSGRTIRPIPIHHSHQAVIDQIRRHFGEDGECGNLLQLPSKEMTAAVAQNWIRMPILAAEKILAEAEAITDPVQRGIALARAQEIRQAVQRDLPTIERLQGEMTPERTAKLFSSAWADLKSIVVSNVSFCAIAAGLGAACHFQALTAGTTILLLAAVGFVNREVSKRFKERCNSAFDQTVKAAFEAADDSPDTAVQQIAFSAALAYVVHASRDCSPIALDPALRLSPAAQDSFHMHAHSIKRAITRAMEALYGQYDEVPEVVRERRYDRTLRRFTPGLEELKRSWGSAPAALAVFATTAEVVTGFTAAAYVYLLMR